MKHLRLFESFISEAKYNPVRELEPGEPYTYDLTCYHATVLDFWPSIQRYGLIPGKENHPGQTWKTKYGGKAIYYHLSFPIHELLNSYDEQTGQPYNMVIEARFKMPGTYILPDEEISLDPAFTPKAIKNKDAIALFYGIPSRCFTHIHMIDTDLSRSWAKDNINKRFNVKFHPVDSE